MLSMTEQSRSWIRIPSVLSILRFVFSVGMLANLVVGVTELLFHGADVAQSLAIIAISVGWFWLMLRGKVDLLP